MTIFQSWADIVIMLVIAIAYVWTYIAQRNTIKAQKDTIIALESQVGASKVLTDIIGTNFNTYREMLKVDDIQTHIDLKVSMQLSAAVDEIIANTGKAMAEDAKILERATEMVSEDLFRFCQSSLNFAVFLLFQLNFTHDAIKAVAKNFFPENPKAEEIMLSELVKLKLKYPNGISVPEKKTDQKIN